jgi:hypothetical protein
MKIARQFVAETFALVSSRRMKDGSQLAARLVETIIEARKQ